MPLRNISAGNVPDEINVIIEIPLSSEPVKYEKNVEITYSLTIRLDPIKPKIRRSVVDA